MGSLAAAAFALGILAGRASAPRPAARIARVGGASPAADGRREGVGAAGFPGEGDERNTNAGAASGEGGHGPDCLGGLLSGWARRDPGAALAWAEGLGGAERRDFLGTVLFQLARLDPERALEAVAALPAGSLRFQTIEEVAPHLAARDRERALAWAGALPNAAERLAARQAIVGRLAEDDPEAAAAVLASLAPQDLPADLRDELDRQIAETWLASDPERGAAWIASLPSDRVTDEVLREWAAADPAGAAAFLERHRGSTSFDEFSPEAYSHAAAGLARKDPEAALAWAERIGEPSAREWSRNAALSTWTETDPEAAARAAGTRAARPSTPSPEPGRSSTPSRRPPGRGGSAARRGARP
jgi:hypothetical protein